MGLTGGPSTSMIFLARTAEGIVSIDLGWWGNGDVLRRALDTLAADSSAVTHVFITHAHRDHLAAWPSVRHAVFHLARGDSATLFGQASHGGWLPRLADRVKPPRLPAPGEIAVQLFATDTVYVIGADTVRAYLVAGHTQGSAVYLLRGVLFLGDAVTHSKFTGFGPARRGYSSDARAAAQNLRALWARLPRDEIRWACTAHARCARFDDRFIADANR